MQVTADPVQQSGKGRTVWYKFRVLEMDVFGSG